MESAVGAGSTFKVYLPEAEGSAAAVTEAVAGPAAPAGGTETIVLLEDEDGLRTIAREILEEAGYRILEARDVGEGIAFASAPSACIDAVLSDLVMPGGSGPQGVALIRALHPRIRTLYMSGYPDLDARRGALADELIEKPFTADSLLRRVRKMLDD